MSPIEFITIVQKMLMLVLELVAPVLLVSVIVGLAISIFQSVTQIQESTLTFVPKIFATSTQFLKFSKCSSKFSVILILP